MILRIARKELLDITRDGRFRLLAGLVLAIAVLSLAAGWTHYRDVQRQHEQARRATREQWLGQQAKSPHSAAHYGVYAFKPKNRLSLIDTGIDPYVGVAAWLEAHKQNEFKYRPAQDRTAVQRFGELTAAEGFLVLLPLFIVLVTFSAFAGEREQGTLRQLVSLGVSRRDLAWGKALGVTLALGLVIVPVTAAGAVCVALTVSGGTAASDAVRAVCLGLLYLAYFAIFIAVGIGVSARARSSRLALVVLLAFWFANSLIAPRAASDLAAALYPAPSSASFQAAMERDLADTRPVAARLEQRRRELMERYDAASMDAVPINFSGISLQEGEEHGNEVFDRHYGRLFAIYARQNDAWQHAGLFAPFLSMRALSMGLAGTDFLHHHAFVQAAEDYRRLIQRVMNNDIAEHAKPGAVYTAGEALWRKVPDFAFEAPGVARVLAGYAGSLILMALWLAGAVWFALSGASRVQVD